MRTKFYDLITGTLFLTALGLQAFGETVVIGSITVAHIVGQIILTAIFLGLALALRPSAPKPADGHQATRQEIPPKIMGYGRVRIGGNYTLYEVKDDASVDVVALVDGHVRGFEKFYLHDDEVNLHATTGYVIEAVGHDDDRYLEHVYLKRRYGLETETAYSEAVTLLPTLWTNDHRGDGTASLLLVSRGSSAETFPMVYPRGLPIPSAVLDMPAIWDARDPAQDPDDPDTWVDYPVWDVGDTYAAGDRVLYTADPDGGGAVYYSRVGANIGNVPDEALNKWCRVDTNPVLILIDKLTSQKHGLGLDRTVLIDPVIDALMAEADICDELVQKKNLDYEPRYACAGWFTYDTEPEKIIAAILASCDGWMTEDGEGALALTVGKYRAPADLEMGPECIIDFSWQDGIEDESVVNDMPFRYTSPAHKYKEAPGQAWRDEDDITDRGIVRSQTLDLTWVQSHSQGRRLVKRAMAKANARLRGAHSTTLYGLAFLGQRWVRLSYPDIAGFESIIVEVTKCERNIMTGLLLWTWHVINPNEIDAWDKDTEEGEPPVVADDKEDDLLPVPQDVQLELVGDETTGFTVKVSFDDPLRADLTYVMRFRLTDDPTNPGNPGPWIEQSVSEFTTDGDRITLSTTALPTDQDFVFQVASVGTRGSRSEWSDTVTGVTNHSIIRETDEALRREDGASFIREDA